jgi:hypothetical protein
MGDGPPLQPGESSLTSRSATKDAKRFKKGKTETAAIHTWDEMMRREYLEMENMRYICGGLVLEALLTRSIGRTSRRRREIGDVVGLRRPHRLASGPNNPQTMEAEEGRVGRGRLSGMAKWSGTSRRFVLPGSNRGKR